jgi:hypothetical protein
MENKVTKRQTILFPWLYTTNSGHLIFKIGKLMSFKHMYYVCIKTWYLNFRRPEMTFVKLNAFNICLNFSDEIMNTLNVGTNSFYYYYYYYYYYWPWSFFIIIIRSRVSAVGIATGYRLDDRGVGVRVPVRARFFSSLQRPGRLRDPRSLLSKGNMGLFSWGKAVGALNSPLID